MLIKGPSFLQSELEDYYEHESSPLVEVDMFKEIRPYVQVAKTKMNVSDNEYKLGSDRFCIASYWRMIVKAIAMLRRKAQKHMRQRVKLDKTESYDTLESVRQSPKVMEMK